MASNRNREKVRRRGKTVPQGDSLPKKIAEKRTKPGKGLLSAKTAKNLSKKKHPARRNEATFSLLSRRYFLKNQARYQALFEHIPTGVTVLKAVDGGRDFVFKDLNPSALNRDKTSKEKLLGKRLTEIFPPVRDIGILDALRKVWADGRPEHLLTHFHRDDKDPGNWRENSIYKLPGGEIVLVYEDITERKLAENALRESEEKLKYVFDHSILGKSITSPTGEIQANAVFCKMLGYSLEEMRGFHLRDITHPADWEETKNHFEEILSGQKDSARFVKRFVHKDGSTVWADVDTVLLRNKKGEPLHFLTAVSDITDRMKAEEALLASEERARLLFDAMEELIVLYEAVFDKNGHMVDYRILDSNRAFEASLGFSREQIRDRLASEVYGTGALLNLENFAKVIETGQSVDFETDFAPLGRYFSVSAFAISPRRFATVTTDITERKLMETKLREDEERYRTLFETSDDAILLLGSEVFVDCNERSVRLYGCSDKTDLIGKTPWNFSPVQQPDGCDSVKKARTYIEAAINGTPQRFYWRHTRLDGSPVETEVCLNSLTLGGKPYLQAIVQDIGERKKAEEALRRALKEKETLLREVYHRTKNNMAVIGSMLSLRARHLADEKAVGVLREIEDKIRIMSLVHKKLYESKDLHRIDLREYITDLAAGLVESHKDSGIILTVRLDLEEIPVPIDIAIPCGMILNELFSNVFKHAFSKESRGEVRIRLARSEEDLELDVGDNGAGVPAGFDFRNQPTLGLQTLFMLIEHQLQGSVRLKTGRGLTWRIRFPYPPDRREGET